MLTASDVKFLGTLASFLLQGMQIMADDDKNTAKLKEMVDLRTRLETTVQVAMTFRQG